MKHEKTKTIHISMSKDDLEEFENLIHRGIKADNIDSKQKGLCPRSFTEAEFNHERNRVIRWLIETCIDEFSDYPIGVMRRITKSHPAYRRLKDEEEWERRQLSDEDPPDNILQFPGTG
ncbi:hypothetical protein SAMN05920897_101325 [Alkalispirochaeta americana]|uniref:Uncharacterized protein n=1 Tax=Alkalispirochaeta americana TaxID=159291 RepID=A0A1N6NM32_9SPIO|nr:hypothetical protein [Alkalispirochaeta americana]SIP93144.1 hypothetical protein SAMN05920897_101325 [Alkalispirochaeta americana]